MTKYLYYSIALFAATLLIMTGVEFIGKSDVGIDELVLVCAYSVFNLCTLLLNIGLQRPYHNPVYVYIHAVYFLLALGMSIITKFAFTRTLTIIQTIILVLSIANAPNKNSK